MYVHSVPMCIHVYRRLQLLIGREQQFMNNNLRKFKDISLRWRRSVSRVVIPKVLHPTRQDFMLMAFGGSSGSKVTTWRQAEDRDAAVTQETGGSRPAWKQAPRLPFKWRLFQIITKCSRCFPKLDQSSVTFSWSLKQGAWGAGRRHFDSRFDVTPV